MVSLRKLLGTAGVSFFTDALPVHNQQYESTERYIRSLLVYAEFAEPSDGAFNCRVKRLKPTRKFRQCTFVDNMRHCLLAAIGTEWVVSYAPYMQRSSTYSVTSTISIEYSPVTSLEIEPWLARSWILSLIHI